MSDEIDSDSGYDDSGTGSPGDDAGAGDASADSNQQSTGEAQVHNLYAEAQVTDPYELTLSAVDVEQILADAGLGLYAQSDGDDSGSGTSEEV